MSALLADTPIARRSDPVTSHLAAEAVTKGNRGAQQQRCLDALRAHPGSTSAELAAALNADRFMTARRLPELERAHLVRKGAISVCRVCGSKCVTWWVVELTKEAR